MQNNKIGFNNFKAFGQDMQYFSKKPITLVYGPNSIGKSSLLRAILYKEYIKEQKINGDFKLPFTNKMHYVNHSTNKFGDDIDFGSFDKIVHKNDISKTIDYDINYTNSSDIISFIGYKNFICTEVIELIASFDDIWNDLEKRIKQFDQKKQDDFDSLDIEIKFVIDFLRIEGTTNRDINIFDFILFRLLNAIIESIRIKSSIGTNFQSYECYIDDDLLFTYKKDKNDSQSATLFTNTGAFEKIFFDPKNAHIQESYHYNDETVRIAEAYKNGIYFRTAIDDYEEYIKMHFMFLLTNILASKKTSDYKYIGPFRKIPSRTDLHGYKNFYKKQRRKQIKIDTKFKMCLFGSKTRYKFYTLFNNKHFKFLYWIIWFPLYFFCLSKKIVASFYNSIYTTRVGFKFIKPNSNSNHFLWQSLIDNKKVQNKVNEWLKDKGKHNSSYSLNIDNNEKKSSFLELKFYDDNTKINVHPQDMGVGISQSLPIIISCNLYKNANIFIEQPEVHLHPKLQMELADEFIKSYRNNNNQFMIETHSEHLLLRLMKRMRHTAENKEDRDKSLDLASKDICLLYVDNNGQTTYIKELELDEDGVLLDSWPSGFFEDGYKERFE